MTVLVGGVAELYQGDLDVGRRAVERLLADDLGPGVLVEDLSYGAVAVAQRLEEVGPEKLVLVGAVARGRPPGTVARFPVTAVALSPAQVHLAIADSVTGYVGIDLVVEVAHGLGVLPRETVAVEVEPASTAPSTTLSPEAEDALADAVALVRDEVAKAPAGG